MLPGELPLLVRELLDTGAKVRLAKAALDEFQAGKASTEGNDSSDDEDSEDVLTIEREPLPVPMKHLRRREQRQIQKLMGAMAAGAVADWSDMQTAMEGSAGVLAAAATWFAVRSAAAGRAKLT